MLVKEIRALSKDKNCYFKKVQRMLSLGVPPKDSMIAYNRIKVIERLKKVGICVRNNNCSLYINGLSPGCISCTTGKRELTLGLTDNCTRNCFYCYQHRPQPFKNNMFMPFSAIKAEIIGKNKEGGLDSFAFSGGEPLFALDNVFRTLALVKKLCGSKCQTRLYTNADLLTVPVLRGLRNYGLDEIRFGLNGGDINFSKLAKAKRYISRVMIEMPVFPDGEVLAKKILNEADKLKIFGVNLKEMNFSGYNKEAFKQRGYFLKTVRPNPYHFARCHFQPLYAIYGSERICLKLMAWVKKNKFAISVHYCSINNKKNFLLANLLRVRSRYKRQPFEVVANNGLLKSLVVYSPAHDHAYKDLKKANIPENEIFIDHEQGKLFTHMHNLKFLDTDKCTVAIQYCIEPYGRDIVDIKPLNC